MGTRAVYIRRAVVSYWRKYVHEVLFNRLGGLSLVRLTDRPDMILDVYLGRKTTMQQQQQQQQPFREYLLNVKKAKSVIEYFENKISHLPVTI